MCQTPPPSSIRVMAPLASTTVDLARIQFATTSIYHFLFVPLTLGLAPLVAIMQTLWYRSQDDAWLRLTRFFGALFLINFAIGVATGLVQEFQFGMSWSVYSNFVGGVFGAPLAIEGLAAFMVEATFLGSGSSAGTSCRAGCIWPRSGSRHRVLAVGLHDPRGQLVDATPGRPRRVDGKAELTSVSALLTNSFAVIAWIHVVLAGLIFGSMVMFGISCWHLLRERDVELFGRAAKLALIVAVPATLIQLSVGNRFGEAVTSAQGMKIAASEAQWNTCEPCGFSLFQIGGFSEQDETPSFSITVPRVLSWMATGSFSGKVEGLNQLQQQEQRSYGRGNYLPNVRLMYWSMRVMAMLGWRCSSSPRWGVAVPQAEAAHDAGSCGRRWWRCRSRTSPRLAWLILPRWAANRGSCRTC